MTHTNQLLQQNREWSQRRRLEDPAFFERLELTQSPKFLWIGCSDSRVPADAITGTQPGEIFVHRNIANMVVHTDLNLLSVLTYAVDVLEVEHVIVCGHHGCGAVRSAMGAEDFGMLNEWLRNIKDVYAANFERLLGIADGKEREDALVELSATAQMQNLAKTSIVQNAWRERGGPWLHAWVYDLSDGILHELASLPPDTTLAPPYAFDRSRL